MSIRLHFRPKTPALSASSEGEDGEVDPFLPGGENATLTLEVETLSDDIFSTAPESLTTTELNLSEIMSNTSSQLEFPSSFTDNETVDVLERLGEDKRPEEVSRKLDYPVGSSKFTLHPSSVFRFNTNRDSSSSCSHQLAASLHHHHHHRRRHRHHHASAAVTSNFLTSPHTSSNNNISGFSNGGLVLNHEPSTSVSGGFNMAMPSTSASENVFVRATGFGGGLENLTNGPISTESKYNTFVFFHIKYYYYYYYYYY